VAKKNVRTELHMLNENYNFIFSENMNLLLEKYSVKGKVSKGISIQTLDKEEKHTYCLKKLVT